MSTQDEWLDIPIYFRALHSDKPAWEVAWLWKQEGTQKQEVNTMADEWEKQEGMSDMWIPTDEGEELVGEVTDIFEGSYGKQYTIKKEDNEEVRTPSHKVLQSRLIKAKIGDRVKIVFTGEEPPAVKGQNPMKMYDVFISKK